MNTTEKYRDFILDNLLKDTLQVQLLKPKDDGKMCRVVLGGVVWIEVKMEIIERYSRSFKAKLFFEGYEVEQLFFTPLNSAPKEIKERVENKIENTVSKTLPKERILQMYEQRTKEFYQDCKNYFNKENKIWKI